VHPLPEGRQGHEGRLTTLLEGAIAHLERHRVQVNELNVFPVADGDTGDNMLATLRAFRDAGPRGALTGARGNSGVILSQLLAGLVEGGPQEAVRRAYAAVPEPVEGTMLTVARDMAAAGDLEQALHAGRESLRRGPSLLPALREAGVVDSGGQGLFRLFQGALRHLKGLAPVKAPVGAGRSAAAAGSTLAARIDEGFGYETMFLVQAHPGKALDVDAIRDHLEAIGESVLVAGDARALKVHVHNERPDEVIGYGLGIGALSKISVENLDNQARDVQEARATEFTGVTAGEGHSTNGASDEAPIKPGPAIVAVVAGDGLARVFEEFGVDQILNGGQTNNPSTGELLRVARLARAREVLLLPNNPNVRLAAEQAAKVCEDKRLVVVPTRNAAEGIAALFALDPTLDAAANAGPMTEASRAIQSVQVTEAVRNATIGGKKVKQGQTIALDPDDGLVAVNGDRNKAVLAAVAAFEPGYELITLYYGADATLAEAEAMSKRIHDVVPAADVEVVHGGQPHYRYLISAE